MREHSFVQTDGGLSSVELSLDPFLVITVCSIALGIIYMVGFDPFPSVQSAFHDLRHAIGFPCF
ncbi:MAG: CbtB domain-containing protein [Bdellovibrionia bacterium]